MSLFLLPISDIYRLIYVSRYLGRTAVLIKVQGSSTYQGTCIWTQNSQLSFNLGVDSHSRFWVIFALNWSVPKYLRVGTTGIMLRLFSVDFATRYFQCDYSSRSDLKRLRIVVWPIGSLGHVVAVHTANLRCAVQVLRICRLDTASGSGRHSYWSISLWRFWFVYSTHFSHLSALAFSSINYYTTEMYSMYTVEYWFLWDYPR